MLIAIIGDNCTGKSSIADKLAKKVACIVYTGKDYLRLAKNELEARKNFSELLERSACGNEHIIYVISEPEHLAFLPSTAVKVLVTADIDVIKMRFAERLGGKLPPPVASMLEKKHGQFHNEKCTIAIHNVNDDSADDIVMEILELMA